jgi:hypothetical protein
MVRAGMAPRPAPPPPPAPPPRPSPEEIERAARRAPALVLSPSASVAALPGVGGVMGGPALAIGFRGFGLSESIFGRWLTGEAHGDSTRWLELGLSVAYNLWISRSFRLAIGAEGAFASVHAGDAIAIEGSRGQRETWSARAGGAISFDARLRAPLWLSLSVAPGAILRPARYDTAASAGRVIEGAWLGFDLGVRFEPLGLR